MFLDYFDVRMVKIIYFFLKYIYIILMCFKIKNILKNNHYHTLKHLS